jgi:hypothetical protein
VEKQASERQKTLKTVPVAGFDLHVKSIPDIAAAYSQISVIQGSIF